MSCPPSDRAALDKVPAALRPSPLLAPVRGAYPPHALPARMHDLRHTPRHHPRHAPYPPPALRPSHTPSVDEEDIGSSDSSSTTSDYTSGESEGSKDELDEEDEADEAPQGFGFSAATWTSGSKESRRYYPGTHQAPPSYTRAFGRRSSQSPARAGYSYRRPVSPEPLYREYREYRDSRHQRARTSRSSQTSPVRIEPVPAAGPRSFVRALTPSRYRRRPSPDPKQRPKYQYESRVPPPPPSLSAPLTLRPPPKPRAPQPPRPNGTALSSNAHYPAPPRMVRPPQDDGEDEVDPDDHHDPPPPPPPRRTPSLPGKRPALLPPGGSSTSTFALSGGPSAPANNNGTTSTTTTFHVTTPRAISASLAAAQSAAAQPPLQADSEKAEAEKMRIPSFKRGGKTRYQCLYCSKDFSRKNDAYRHMSRKHNDNATEFICVCGRVLSRGDALTRHMRTCRESKEKGPLAVAIPGSAFVQGAPVKVPAAANKKKGAKKRRASQAPPPPGAIDMDVDGEEELDDVSMEEED
ncbi:hypothetical protein C0993_005472 [Termitomyces sp. T159_Od127]|nr:hypothetical protein C0993_005472 [Termitomyces sp. T159_Od127]